MTEQADPQPEILQSPARGAPVGSPLLRSDPSAAAIRNPQSNILIVEDSPVEAELLRRLLARAGYAVTAAADGEQALQAARAQRPALVISDINMPVMGGYELCHALKYDDELWNVPVMLLTVLAEPEDIMRAINTGADAYITKPFIEPIMLERIRALLDRPADRKRAEERRSERVEYDGQFYTVSGDVQQVLNLLFSLYKNALSQNRDLANAQEELKRMADAGAKADAERIAQLERELQSMGRLASEPGTAVTASLYGRQPLRQYNNALFRELVDTHRALLDRVVEEQLYREERSTGAVPAFAARLGFLYAGPQDLIDIHTETLKELAGSPRHQAYVVEGRMLLLELMGRLAGYYRNYAQGGRRG